MIEFVLPQLLIIMQLVHADILANLTSRNDSNLETRGSEIVITNGVGLVIASIAVGIRIYTRVAITRNFGWDDIFILLALVNNA